jgi:hypothetical protein
MSHIRRTSSPRDAWVSARRAKTKPSMQRSADVLARRIVELDRTPHRGAVSDDRCTRGALLDHFAGVMGDCTDTFMRVEAGRDALIAPAVADKMIKTSRLLTDIAVYDPSLIYGPLRVDRQHWTAIAAVDGLVSAQPCASRFIVPSVTIDEGTTVKPQGIGLYTSTGTSEGNSMWRIYLESFMSSGLYPLPWYTWELEVDADNIRVAEIVSATKWVEFVETYARNNEGVIYPDWVKIAREFDAVHVTLPTIAAAQGFYFDTPQGIIPSAFWDIETTFWLRWCFSGAHLVETVDGGG